MLSLLRNCSRNVDFEKLVTGGGQYNGNVDTSAEL
jgi:hypothetical protein